MTLPDALRSLLGPDQKLHDYQERLLEALEEARKTGKPVQWFMPRPAGMATVRRIWNERLKQLSPPSND